MSQFRNSYPTDERPEAIAAPSEHSPSPLIRGTPPGIFRPGAPENISTKRQINHQWQNQQPSERNRHGHIVFGNSLLRRVSSCRSVFTPDSTCPPGTLIACYLRVPRLHNKSGIVAPARSSQTRIVRGTFTAVNKPCGKWQLPRVLAAPCPGNSSLLKQGRTPVAHKKAGPPAGDVFPG